MTEFGIEFIGDKELFRQFMRLSAAVADEGMDEAVMAGGKVIADAAREKAPVRTGKLKRNIVVQKGKSRLYEAEAVVGWRKVGKGSNPKNAFYGPFVEKGTAHSPAQPHLRPAFDEKKDEAVKKEGEVLRGVILREAAK